MKAWQTNRRSRGYCTQLTLSLVTNTFFLPLSDADGSHSKSKGNKSESVHCSEAWQTKRRSSNWLSRWWQIPFFSDGSAHKSLFYPCMHASWSTSVFASITIGGSRQSLEIRDPAHNQPIANIYLVLDAPPPCTHPHSPSTLDPISSDVAFEGFISCIFKTAVLETGQKIWARPWWMLF